MNKTFKINTKDLITISILIAIEIVLSRFLSITTPFVKIGFAFVPIAITGILYGPFYAGCAAAIADIIGATIFPAGPYFPGFTLTAFLTGMVYGLLLHNQRMSIFRVSTAVLIITILLNLGLNSIWLFMITGKGLLAILPARIFKTIIIVPIEIIIIGSLNNIALQRLQQH